MKCSWLARSLVKGLLCKNPKARVGSLGVEQAKQHAWFADIDFGLLEAGYVAPPVAPKLDEVHGPINGNEGPPQDEHYNDVRLTPKFQESLDFFNYTSATAVQSEIVEVLTSIDTHKMPNKDANYAMGAPKKFKLSCLTMCQIM